METSTLTSNPAADLITQIKTIDAEVIPAIIPAVTEGVITTLTQMGIIPNKTYKLSKETPSSPSADDQTHHTLDDSKNNETVLNPPIVMGESAGPSFLSDIADTSGNTSNCKAISLIRPLEK